MLGRDSSDPAPFRMVDLGSLVPADHKLRRLDSVLDSPAGAIPRLDSEVDLEHDRNGGILHTVFRKMAGGRCWGRMVHAAAPPGPGSLGPAGGPT